VFKALADSEPQIALKSTDSSNGAVAPKPGAKKPPPPVWGDDDDQEDDKKPAWDRKSKDDEDSDYEDDAKAKKKPAKKGPLPKKRAADDDDDQDEDEEQGEDDAFAELLEQTTLSPLAKKQITGELGLREKGLWIGQPDPKIMTVRGIPKAIAGVIIFVFLAIFGSVASGATLGHDNPSLAAILIGGIIVLALVFAVLVFGLVLFMERKKAIGAAYVITNKRCITFLPGWFSGPAPTSYYPNMVQNMRRMPSWIFGGDAGDIVFRSVTTVTRTYHQRGGVSTSVSTTYYGFLGIRNLDEIEGRIRQALFADDDDDEDDDDEDDRRKKKKKGKKKKRRDDDDDD
jgi:hypothetical protein